MPGRDLGAKTANCPLKEGKSSLGLGNKESYGSWLDFLKDTVDRGMGTPVAVTSDGAPGLIRAIEAVFPRSVRIRCWLHRMGNLQGKVPQEVWPVPITLLKRRSFKIKLSKSEELFGQDTLVVQARREGGLLRVPFIKTAEGYRIITVYWTSRVDKYWKEESDESSV